MQKALYTLLLLSLFLSVPYSLDAQRIDRFQRKLEKYRRDEWPPERSYSRVSLGYAMQRTFKRHCEYCGFITPAGKRDFVPNDISKFLGRRNLRTRVETADIRGGGLLYYVFTDGDILMPFDEVSYTPSRVFRLNSVNNQFVVNPDENFDSFIFHKTCSGYLKAALNAGIEPPYAAFQAALDTDSRRESSILALSGSFTSPLDYILKANDYRTTEAMMKIWEFYQQYPEYIDNAYYLREFEGVMIKHITSAEENYKIEMEGGLNLNAPLSARLKANFGLGRGGATSFFGNDWETIIYTDFAGNYEKRNLFSPMPSPTDISRYLNGISLVFQKAQDLPLMIEGLEHKHFLIVEGIPENMTNNFWVIENVQPGVYAGQPALAAQPYYDAESDTYGCRFTISGRPLASNFRGPVDSRPSKLNVRYRIRSREPVGGQYLSFHINEEIQTSSHPIANIADGAFDLTKKEGWDFAFQWKFAIEIEDHYNPIDFKEQPYIGNLLVRRSDKELGVRIVQVEPDAQRKRFIVTLETQQTYPLDRIDNTNMQSYNMALDIHLKSASSAVTSVRPIKGILRFPAIKPKEPPQPTTAEVDAQPGILPEQRPAAVPAEGQPTPSLPAAPIPEVAPAAEGGG